MLAKRNGRKCACANVRIQRKTRLLFSRPMGKRGSAHRAFVIRIFAYAGYKRDDQGRFVLFLWGVWMDQGFLPLLALRARGWTEKCICDSRPVLSFPWRRVLARAVDPRRVPWSFLFIERSSSTRESGTLPGDRRRRPRASRHQGARPFCRDSARTSGPTGTTQ